MNDIFLKDLFRKIIGNVLGLYPEADSSDEEVILFSDRQSDFSLPVFMGEEGVKLFFEIHRNGEETEMAMQDRLCMLNDNAISKTDDRGADWIFPYQGVFNSGIWKGFRGYVEHAFAPFVAPADEIRPGFLLEAYFVGYFLHEFRHIFQLRELGYEVLPIPEDRFPPLTNGIIPHAGLRNYWSRWMKEMMRGYEETHYLQDQERENLLLGEEDAMNIQLFAFDCWLTAGFTEEEKYSRLRGILEIQ